MAWFDTLVASGKIDYSFNPGFFFGGDSRYPELAGIGGAIAGSFYALLVCFLLSFPLGIAAAVYLEEFAKDTRMTRIIEANINNLAAVPSVIFGLLGLAVILNFFGLPRGTPLVGGMVLALMTLPTIIIACRSSLRAVSPGIRQGALAMGASPIQVTFQQVLPAAMPGTLTGTIIGLAQALGETAPLLMIGMVAFIANVPATPLDSSAALPVQIYLWAESAERGFVEKTAAAIMVIMTFLILMNLVAVIIRSRTQTKVE
jgi:phosphate transport system permease protein